MSGSRRGFVLIATCIALVVLLALAGVIIDVGRMYLIKNELQAYADSAALSAALELNGSDSGIAQGRAKASQLASGPNAMRWDLGTQPVTNVTASFSADQKSWAEKPKHTGDIRFVRIVVAEPAPVIFLRVFQPFSSVNVAASGIATKTSASARLVQ